MNKEIIYFIVLFAFAIPVAFFGGWSLPDNKKGNDILDSIPALSSACVTGWGAALPLMVALVLIFMLGGMLWPNKSAAESTEGSTPSIWTQNPTARSFHSSFRDIHIINIGEAVKQVALVSNLTNLMNSDMTSFEWLIGYRKSARYFCRYSMTSASEEGVIGRMVASPNNMRNHIEPNNVGIKSANIYRNKLDHNRLSRFQRFGEPNMFYANPGAVGDGEILLHRLNSSAEDNCLPNESGQTQKGNDSSGFSKLNGPPLDRFFLLSIALFLGGLGWCLWCIEKLNEKRRFFRPAMIGLGLSVSSLGLWLNFFAFSPK